MHWKKRQTTIPTPLSTSPLAHQATTMPECLLPGCRPPASPLAHRLPPATGGLQQHQMPAANLPRRCREMVLIIKK
jgi:hypothetical protein